MLLPKAHSNRFIMALIAGLMNLKTNLLQVDQSILSLKIFYNSLNSLVQ